MYMITHTRAHAEQWWTFVPDVWLRRNGLQKQPTTQDKSPLVFQKMQVRFISVKVERPLPPITWQCNARPGGSAQKGNGQPVGGGAGSAQRVGGVPTTTRTWLRRARPKKTQPHASPLTFPVSHFVSWKERSLPSENYQMLQKKSRGKTIGSVSKCPQNSLNISDDFLLFLFAPWKQFKLCIEKVITFKKTTSANISGAWYWPVRNAREWRFNPVQQCKFGQLRNFSKFCYDFFFIHLFVVDGQITTPRW